MNFQRSKQPGKTAVIVLLFAGVLAVVLLTGFATQNTLVSVSMQKPFVAVDMARAYEIGRKAALDWDPSARLLRITNVQVNEVSQEQSRSFANLQQVAWNLIFASPVTGSRYHIEMVGEEILRTTEDPILAQASPRELEIALVTEQRDMFTEKDILKALSFDYQKTGQSVGLRLNESWHSGFHYRLLKERGEPQVWVTAANENGQVARVVFDATTGEVITIVHKEYAPYAGAKDMSSRTRSYWVTGIK